MKFVGRGAAVAVAASAIGGFLAAGSPSALAADSVPYKDPGAVGTIGLCAENGTPLTHGSVYDEPFVWKAIDSTAAVAPYNVQGASATLYAYQPRQDVDPRQWSGSQLSAASRFTNPAHPTAAMTGLDGSLAGFLGAYSPQWDGLIQLRIYLGAPNQPIYSATYDATNIKVAGNSWTIVGGDSVSCGSGSAVSLEQVLATSSAVAASLAAQTTEKPTKSAAAGHGATPSGNQTSSGSAGANGQAPLTPPATAPVGSSGVPATGSSPASSVGASTGHAGSSSDTLLLVLLVVLVIGAAFVGIQWLRSRA